uniref:LRAT domain-containing protein n=1 Tax=Sparus aurata TaxID=8175 RepID=A0A671WQ47_SPAAU
MTPGDLIEISQPAHTHWAVYVGDGYVVHVDHRTSPLSGVSVAAYSSSRFPLTGNAVVRKEKLEGVAGNSQWKINNTRDMTSNPCPAHIIVREALRLVGNVIEYNEISNNCEHFVTKLRYGRALSQVSGPIFSFFWL